MFFGLLYIYIYILCLRFCPNVFWAVIYPLLEVLSQCFFGHLFILCLRFCPNAFWAVISSV